MVLTGTEVKSLRAGKANLQDGWVSIENGEAILRDVHISPYDFGNRLNHVEKQPRKLLLKKRELIKLEEKSSEKGFSVIPLRIYLSGRWIKCEIALARGKKDFDKREATKKKEAGREIARAMKRG